MSLFERQVSVLAEFFRHCPQCGRRFQIKLTGKQLLSSDREVRGNKLVQLGGIQGIAGSGMPPYMMLKEGPPIVVEKDQFQYSYKCGHCGHEWSERRTETLHA